MSYIVVYQREDGSSGVEECADLDLAVVTAERLRNVDSVERPRIFKTEEITYDFKPYYRVEVTSDAAGVSAAAAAAAPPAPSPASTDTITSEPVREVVAEEPVVEEVVEPEPEVVEVSSTDDTVIDNDIIEEVAPPAPKSGGLYGESGDIPDVSAPVVDEIVPPRRGLFGR